MKAIVCVKQVPDTSGKVAVNENGTLDRASMATIINPDDLNAVEAALVLKEQTGCEVDVVTMGPPPAEGMLRELLARGCDIQKNGNTLTVKRMLEDGYMMIEVQTPCLITCISELNQPRYMSVNEIFGCYDKPVEVLDYNALKDDPLIDATTIGLSGSPTNILTSFTPPQKGVGMMLEGADAATAEKLAGMLAAKHII